MYTPPIASLQAFIPYVNGMTEFIVLKKVGVIWTGKVPPEPPIWMTNKNMAIPLPRVLKHDTRVNIRIQKAILHSIKININKTGSFAVTPNKNRSPFDIIIDWIRDRIRKNDRRPKYLSILLYCLLGSVDNIVDRIITPTQAAKTL